MEGPFHSIKDFHDHLLAAATRQKPGPELITGPYLYRESFSDTCAIYFTHGDLSLGNILISGDPGSHRISSVVDWEQSGWYPEYWEYCKVQYAVDYEHQIRTDGWAEKILGEFEEEARAFGEYCIWRNP